MPEEILVWVRSTLHDLIDREKAKEQLRRLEQSLALFPLIACNPGPRFPYITVERISERQHEPPTSNQA